MRLFLALWPDDAALRRIEEIQQALQEAATRQGVRFVRPERIHLTLHFYGEFPERDLPELKQRLSTVRHPPIELRSTGFGAFPGLNRPKVVWLGLEGEGLAELQEQAAKAVEGLVEPADAVFIPHLTLARVNPGSQEVGRRVRSIPPDLLEPPAVWTADKVALVQTLPSAVYDDVGSFALE
ncbi:MAG TPA: RNA 2',3'-cyclic phosphodiesterase [Fimbriimonas sp.]